MPRTKTYDDIRPRDSVTFYKYDGGTPLNPRVYKATGHVVMKGPCGWVVNTGGRYGIPALCSRDTFIKIN
jgi:hypothetical protein